MPKDAFYPRTKCGLFCGNHHHVKGTLGWTAALGDESIGQQGDAFSFHDAWVCRVEHQYSNPGVEESRQFLITVSGAQVRPDLLTTGLGFGYRQESLSYSVYQR